MPYPENLSEFDLGWVTGIIEGEGHIGLHRKKCRNGFQYQAIAEVVNTDFALLEKLKFITEVGNICKRNYSSFQSGCWAGCWTVGKQSHLLWFLQQVYSHLLEKKTSAEIVMQFLQSRFSRVRYSSYTKEEFILSERYIAYMAMKKVRRSFQKMEK